MKKIGIISDIHSNKEALYQVLLDMEKRGIDEIVCLGDMITKYIYPRQVVDTLKSECKILIKGNCDDNVVKNENFKYAREQLGLHNIEYLSALPVLKQEFLNELLVNYFHAMPENISKIYNPLNTMNINTKEMLLGDKSQISFAGHTHIPYIQIVSPKGNQIVTEHPVFIEKDTSYIVNVGSVGDPLIETTSSKQNWLISETMNYVLFTYDTPKPSIEIINAPYRDLLVKVYMDFVLKQQLDENGKRQYPRSPKDTQKIYESLRYQNNTIYDGQKIMTPEEIDHHRII